MDSINKTSPKDVFLHLLSIVTLYASATSFLVLAFQYVNLAFPDPLQYEGGILGMIRWAVATLVVVFPVHLISMKALYRGYQSNAAKRGARIRKWLIYFTLFIAALIIIGDLVSLINTFLGGELTVRFFLKVLAMFFVAGSIFTFYLWDMRRDGTE